MQLFVNVYYQPWEDSFPFSLYLIVKDLKSRSNRKWKMGSFSLSLFSGLIFGHALIPFSFRKRRAFVPKEYESKGEKRKEKLNKKRNYKRKIKTNEFLKEIFQHLFFSFVILSFFILFFSWVKRIWGWWISWLPCWKKETNDCPSEDGSLWLAIVSFLMPAIDMRSAS